MWHGEAIIRFRAMELVEIFLFFFHCLQYYDLYKKKKKTKISPPIYFLKIGRKNLKFCGFGKWQKEFNLHPVGKRKIIIPLPLKLIPSPRRLRQFISNRFIPNPNPSSRVPIARNSCSLRDGRKETQLASWQKKHSTIRFLLVSRETEVYESSLRDN